MNSSFHNPIQREENQNPKSDLYPIYSSKILNFNHGKNQEPTKSDQFGNLQNSEGKAKCHQHTQYE